MKLLFYILSSFCFTIIANAQNGCTDRAATNYDSSAVSNDGTCSYLRAIQPFTLMVTTPNVSENSGVEWINGNLFTFGDSGNPPDIFKIDTTTGSISQTINVSNLANNDWEDITSDSTYVYIGDFGNNNGNRTDLRILKIALSQFISNTNSSVSVTAEAINFSYSDQTDFTSNSNTNFDCESVISIADSLYIFTKDAGDFQTRVYALPKTPGTYTVSPYTTYNVNGKISGADYNPINKEVVLIGSMSGHLNSFIWYLNDFKGTQFFSGNKRRVELGNSSYKWQTEGICFYEENKTHRVFLSCETDGSIGAGVYFSDVNQITTQTVTSVGLVENKNEGGVKYFNDNNYIKVLSPFEVDFIIIYSIAGFIENMDNVTLLSKYEFSIQKNSSENSSLHVLRLQTKSGQVFIHKIIY